MVPPGDHQVRMEFTYDGGGLAKGGDVALTWTAQKAGEGRVEHTQPMVFSGDETADIGSDTGTAVSEDYGPGSSEFSGTVEWVQLDIDESAEDSDHLISPEERFRVAMSLQ